MNDLFVLAVHNSLVALALALCVFGLTRIWHSPPLAHVLWLLVLLKLVAPPVMHINWPAIDLSQPTEAPAQIVAGPPNEWQVSASNPRLVERPPTQLDAPALAASTTEHDSVASLQQLWNQGRCDVFRLWLGGAALCALVAMARIVRFERLLRDTLPAPARLQQLTLEIAEKLGIRRAPDLRYVECAEIPMVWCASRRPTIVLPIRLFQQLDDRQAAMILAHELAHLRRRDHRVRAVEMIVSIIYWWNPLVWVIRRQIHKTEDLCCDAWVRYAFPDCRKRYAEVVLKSAESLSASRVGVRLQPASPFLHSFSLKARIEMILESRFAPCVSKRSMFVIALFALLMLPSFVQTARTDAWAAPNAEPSASPTGNREAVSGNDDENPALEQAIKQALVWLAKHQNGAKNWSVEPTMDRRLAQVVLTGKTVTSTTSELPYAVRFEQGATRFSNGDKITIVEVRGTAETFTAGNIYWIKGTYTLASHDRAALSAFTTAMDAANGTGPIWQVQTTVVNQGNGTFTLFLPMSCRGWPHVSFYPAGGGESFGGNYIGTGDSVLKQWWGSKKTDRTTTNAQSLDALKATLQILSREIDRTTRTAPAGSGNIENARDGRPTTAAPPSGRE